MKIEYKLSVNDDQADEITVNTLISDHKQTGMDGLLDVQKAIWTVLSRWYMTPEQAKKAVEEE